MKQLPLVVGIDVGTSGVRLSAVDLAGAVTWTRSAPLDGAKPTQEGVHQQEPEQWWDAVCRLCYLFTKARLGADTSGEILGICVTSTSGTLVAVDPFGNAVRPAILYDDRRSSATAAQLTAADSSEGQKWTASHSLSKAIWLRNEEPETWAKVHRLLHPTDWITGKLTGNFDVADHSNVLKLGYEAETRRWHPAIEKAGIPSSLLPCVVPCGQVLGRLCSTAIVETGFPGVPVVAGTTDGMAGLIASGATSAGDANTTLGTTLVWKVLSREKPTGGQTNIYSHLHPSGLWAPGAASNAGPGSLQLPNGIASPCEDLDREAIQHLPSSQFCYPISGRGERFPFVNSNAHAFRTGAAANEAEWYASQLQAIAFVERWGFEVLLQSGVDVGATVFSTGGAASSDSFSKLRASVLKRIVIRCADSNAAFGAAVLGASALHYGGDVPEAIRRMTHHSACHVPDPEMQNAFDDVYGEFRQECQGRGYA
jgi:xylulokinase